jgi:hypothetical protein
MATKGGKPSEEGRVRNWNHVGAKQGQTWDAWIAGDAIGIFCHVGDDPSTPCLKHYLGKTAKCERCSVMHRREWLFFQPVWRERDGKPCVVIFHADQLDVLERLKNLAFVTIGRAEEKKSGMYLRAHLREVKFETAFAWKRLPQDISDWLPTLFNMRGALSGAHLLSGGIESTGLDNAQGAAGNRVLQSSEELACSVDVISETLGLEPPGSAKEKQRARNEEFIARQRNGKTSTNGKH